MDTPTGRIVWFDYLTNDAPKAQAFFRAVFGWNTQIIAMATGQQYTRIMSGGVPIGGYGPALASAPVFRYSEPVSQWLPHLQIANGHESAAKAKSLGGKMVREPTPFADLGKLAVGTDPSGLPFALWQPAKVDSDPGWAGPPNTFCWAELYTANPSSSVMFFKALGGFTETKNQMPDGTYHLLERDGQPRAGARSPMAGMPPGWFAWVRVPDLAAAAAKAQQLGSTIVVPPANMGSMQMALIVDPQGAALGLAQQH